ncbi:MAG: TonB-dependent receptor, partial [Acidobacteria bacterium]|nr:TonB-dependent receptor [Acidobacteriota bacterium]
MSCVLRSSIVMFAALAIAMTGSPAVAQQADEPVEEQLEEKVEEKRSTKVSEEIVVTARKREETVQDVPFSIVAPTEERLRDLGAEDMEDISANVAGFTVQNLGPGQSQVSMRGVSAGQIVRDQPGVKEQVGVYLDESVISLSLFTPDVDLFDVSRVEVLRGPQGTLFGSGSLSGTVRYITNQPELGVSDTIGELNVGFIDDGGTGGSLKAAVNVPMGDSAAMRVAAYYTRYGGFMDAVTPDLSVDEDVNTGDRTGARVAFLFEPSENLSITPRLIYQEVDMDGWNRIDAFNILANPFTTTRPPVTLGGRRQFIQLEEVFTDDFLLADLNVEYDLGALTVTSITSVTDRDVLVVRDAGALTSSITGGSVGLPEEVYTLDSPLNDDTEMSGFTQEVRLSGSVDRLEWVTGAFYSDVDRDYGQGLLVSGFEAMTGIPTAGFIAPTDGLYWSELAYDFKQLALFGEVSYEVSEDLSVTGGLRWYDFDEDRVQSFDGIFADPGTTVGSVEADGFAPRVMLSYSLNETTELNAQVSKGFRLGGINDPLNVPLCSPQDLVTFGGRETWEDEVLWNYEVGSKSSFNDGKTTLNVAAFYMDIEDLQATVTAGTCSSRVIFNVPEARSTGLELEWGWVLNDNFDIAVSSSYVDSELRSTLTSTDDEGNVSVISGIKEGNRLPTVPEFQMAAAASYRWLMNRGLAGYVTGVYQHVGERFTQIGDQAEGFGTVKLEAFAPNTIGGPLTQSTFTFDPELPAYDLVNLRI